jgi:ComF family protein
MWIKKWPKNILNLFFPCFCLYCSAEGKIICDQCLKKIPVRGKIRTNFYSLDKIIYFFNYRHPLVKKAIQTFKYPPYQKEILNYLFLLIAPFWRKNKSLVQQMKKNNFVIVPVPLTRRKKAQRGFNQSELIAQKFSQQFNLPLALNLVKKKKQTPSQTKLNREQRRKNVKDVWQVKDNCPRQIIIVDDVLTTGATITQMAQALEKAGAENIWAIILAKG